MVHKKVASASSLKTKNIVDVSSGQKADDEVDTMINGVEFPQLQWRCYLSYFIIKVQNWKIDVCKWNLLRGTPFGKLILHLLQLEGENLELVDFLLGLWDEEHCGFLIGGSIIKFTADDVALITGLPNRGLKVVKKCKLMHNEEKIPFSRIYLNLRRIERSLDKIISNREDPHPEEDKLFVQLMILFLWGSVLFPSACRTVPAYLANYVENLDTIGSYNWAEFLHSYLVKEITAKSKLLKKRNEGENVVAGYISGLSFIIKVWFFEHVDFGEDSGPSNPDVTPRMLKWVKGFKFWQRKPLFDRLKEIVQGKISVCLLPKDDELELLSRPCIEHLQSHEGNPYDNTWDNQPLPGNCEGLRSGIRGGFEATEQKARESMEGRRKQGRRDSKEQTSEGSELRRLKKVVASLVRIIHSMHKHLARMSDLERKVVKLETLVASKEWELKEHIDFLDDLYECGDLYDSFDEDIDAIERNVERDIHHPSESRIKEDGKHILQNGVSGLSSRNGPDKDKCDEHRKRKLPMIKEHLLLKKKKAFLNKQASMCSNECPPTSKKKETFVNLDDYAGPNKPKKEVQSAPLSYVGRELLPEDERIYLDDFCLKPMRRGEIVFFDQNIVIRRQSMVQYLLGGCTDEEIIDAYALILRERGNEALGKFASFMYLSPMLMGLYLNNLGSYKTFMKAPDKKSLEKVEFLFLPCHVSSANHWMLLVCDTTNHKWTALDSLYDPRHREAAMERKLVLEEYLYCELGFDVRSWSLEYKRECPQQDSGTLDCGVFVMKFMESLISSPGVIDFRAADLRLFRPQIAHKILRRG